MRLRWLETNRASMYRSATSRGAVGDWRIIERREVPDRGGSRLVFVCELAGRRREATVSPQSWATYKLGDSIVLGHEEAVSLEVEGVQERHVKDWRNGEKSQYYAQMRPFRGVSVATWPISRELYEALRVAGCRVLKG